MIPSRHLIPRYISVLTIFFEKFFALLYCELNRIENCYKVMQIKPEIEGKYIDASLNILFTVSFDTAKFVITIWYIDRKTYHVKASKNFYRPWRKYSTLRFLNPFHAYGVCLYPLKSSENQRSRVWKRLNILWHISWYCQIY